MAHGRSAVADRLASRCGGPGLRRGYLAHRVGLPLCACRAIAADKWHGIIPIKFPAASLSPPYRGHDSIQRLVVWSFEDGSYSLRYGKRTAAILRVVPDQTYPAMCRIRFPDGSHSDMANLTRAKDAALDPCPADNPRHQAASYPEAAGALRDSSDRGGSHHRSPGAGKPLHHPDVLGCLNLRHVVTSSRFPSRCACQSDPAFKDELPPPRRPRRLRRAFASAEVPDRPSADEGP
jgi:hypothetical protein